MEEKSERPDLRAERRAGVMATGRKCQRVRLTHIGLPKGPTSTWTFGCARKHGVM